MPNRSFGTCIAFLLPLWEAFGSLWIATGFPWGTLWGTWGCIGTSWGCLGTTLASLGVTLWDPLDSWIPLGGLGPWDHFGPHWTFGVWGKPHRKLMALKYRACAQKQACRNAHSILRIQPVPAVLPVPAKWYHELQFLYFHTRQGPG